MRFWCLAAFALRACGAEESLVEHRYAAIIDAGTMGSRIYVFRWVPARGIIYPDIQDSFGIAPGVASFALSPDRAAASLDPLLEHAQRALRHVQDQWSIIPIYLRATGGMRLLTADEREGVLSSIRGRLRQCPFLFEDEFAMVVTGEERGVYSWLSANKLMGTLHSEERLTASNSFGALDLGGASVQIVFIPEKSVMAHAFPLVLGHHNLRVYSASFLHFGYEEAAQRVASIIIADALLEVQSVIELYHPCFSVGYTWHPRFGYNGNRTFPIDVGMSGSSDFHRCENLLRRIFEKDADCLMPTCSFYGVYQPHTYNNKFIAFHQFAKIAEFLALPQAGSINDLRIAAEYVCSLSYDQLNIVFENVPEDNRVTLCLHSAYMWVLLTYGFGFPKDTRNIEFRRRLSGGHVVDYVLGAMIYELNQNMWLRMAGNVSALKEARGAELMEF